MTDPAQPHAPSRQTTGRPRIAGALCIGALCGAGLVSGNLIAINLFGGRPGDGPFLATFAFPVALVGWGVGLLAIGSPIWALLHALGLTSRWIGAVVGGAITALVAPVLLALPEFDLLNADHGMGWPHSAANVVAFGVIGAVVGWVVVTVAYDRKGPVQ